MYAERVRRLENELYRQPQGAAHGAGLAAEAGSADERPQLYSLDGSRKPGLTSAS
jgi:hypothetical protein